jgi:hypothetical protein
LLKEEFDALVHNKGVQHEDNFEQFFDDGIRRRFGEVIAWAEGTKLRVIMATGSISRKSLAASRPSMRQTYERFNARSITSFGSRSPLAVTLTNSPK